MSAGPAGRGPHAGRSAQDVPAPHEGRRPLYARLLGLQHLRLRAWQRAVLAEGSLAVAVLLVLADLATAWTLLVLPLAVAALVKVHDVVAGMLAAASDGRPVRGARAGTPTAPVPEGSRRRRDED